MFAERQNNNRIDVMHSHELPESVDMAPKHADRRQRMVLPDGQLRLL
jgi:hypothetical protein